ncbi:MAG TPA: hypothetical protein VJY39_14385 [Acidisphaera sp.]|nr:hypothetical protein [Acidisphaera sp.]
MRRLALALLLATQATPGLATDIPTTPGTCVFTRIKTIGHHLRPGPPTLDPGSTVAYDNGVNQISYETVGTLGQARIGDEIMLCLVRIPQHCPPGDARGRIYTGTDLRTLGSWTMPDSEHLCGGA